jgi:Zn-dependent protease
MVFNSGYWFGCLIGLVVHEAAHVCVALGLGIRIKRIGLHWCGPYIVREPGSPTASAIVSAAGPLVNLVLAAMTLRDWPSFAAANLLLGLINLLPTPNSDGRRILRALSLARNSDPRAHTSAAVPHLDLSI